MTEKENILAFYSHGTIDHMPSAGVGEAFVYPVNGFHERPPFDKGGIDWFGCKWEYMEDAGAPAPDCRSEHVLEDICDWESTVRFPDLDEWDWEEAKRLDKIDEIDRENNAVNVVILLGLWERMHVLMGFENALCALLEDTEEVSAFLDAMVDYKIKLIGKISDHYRPDVITFHDDWGTQNAPFFSPDLWRELIKPRMREIVDFSHEREILFEMHSCGKYDEIIPDIAETGVDTLQCMDINDLRAAMAKTGKSMSYCASFHSQKLEVADNVGKLDAEYVREVARKDFEELGATGMYMPFLFPPSNWYEEIVHEEFIRARDRFAGTYN